MKILAIDQSTTTTTAFLFDTDGTVDTLATYTHRQILPQPGWVEHDPRELLLHINACIASGRASGANMFALSNQGESCLAWDGRTGEPLSSVLVWQDARTDERCRALARTHGDEITRRSRLPVDSYFSASKLAWILQHIPAAADCAKTGDLRLGTTDAYFRDQLTGRHETDLATASRTGLLDMNRGTWDQRLCEIYGVPIACLPRITDCNGDLGGCDGLPLRAAIVDQQAALYGHDLSEPGETKVTFGTGAFALSVAGVQCPSPQSGLVPTVAWRKADGVTQYALEGGIHTASAAINWGQELGLFDQFDDLNALDGSLLERGLAFVPALAGLASPYWDQNAKGVWLGLELGTTKRDMMQAMLEGIAYRTHQILVTMSQRTRRFGAIRIDGGMTKNPAFCQTLANITDRAIVVSDLPDTTAFGLAKLAANSANVTFTAPISGNTYEPDRQYVPRHDLFEKACEISRDWGQASRVPT